MPDSQETTPAAFKCGDVDVLCPSIYETEDDVFFIGPYAPNGVLATIGIPKKKLPAGGESAVRFPRRLVEAYLKEYAAKILTAQRAEP